MAWITNPTSTKPVKKKKKKSKPKRTKPCWFCEKPEFPKDEKCFLCGYDHSKQEVNAKAKNRSQWLDETEQQMDRFGQKSTGCRIDLEIHERKVIRESVPAAKTRVQG